MRWRQGEGPARAAPCAGSPLRPASLLLLLWAPQLTVRLPSCPDLMVTVSGERLAAGGPGALGTALSSLPCCLPPHAGDLGRSKGAVLELPHFRDDSRSQVGALLEPRTRDAGVCPLRGRRFWGSCQRPPLPRLAGGGERRDLGAGVRGCALSGQGVLLRPPSPQSRSLGWGAYPGQPVLGGAQGCAGGSWGPAASCVCKHSPAGVRSAGQGSLQPAPGTHGPGTHREARPEQVRQQRFLKGPVPSCRGR